ncbi:hypothetical protein [Streptomyces nanshensis]|uniref:hypothetical protein n=1 Tax=Streptomyces nanshensis TaxID=518642 RepID=UPI00085C9378|nr:hypothetical protein [Streptomyces nanshensis]
MPPGTVLSANAVAVAADVERSWAYRAIKAGVLSEPCFPADVIVLKVYRVLSQFVWPDKPRQRSVKHDLDTWQLTALNATRNAVTDDRTTPETTLYVLQSATYVEHTRTDRAQLESSAPDGAQASPLDAQTVLRLPIGRWIDGLEAVVARTPRSAPRRVAVKPQGRKTPRRRDDSPGQK